MKTKEQKANFNRYNNKIKFVRKNGFVKLQKVVGIQYLLKMLWLN
jgi:hypothetical protein